MAMQRGKESDGRCFGRSTVSSSLGLLRVKHQARLPCEDGTEAMWTGGLVRMDWSVSSSPGNTVPGWPVILRNSQESSGNTRRSWECKEEECIRLRLSVRLEVMDTTDEKSLWELKVFSYNQVANATPDTLKRTSRLLKLEQNPNRKFLQKVRLMQLVLWFDKQIYLHPTRHYGVRKNMYGDKFRTKRNIKDYYDDILVEYEK